MRGRPGGHRECRPLLDPQCIAHRVPGPAGQRGKGSDQTQRVVLAGGQRALPRFLQMHQQQAGTDHRQGQRQSAQAHLPFEHSAGQRNHHGQRADHHGGHGCAGMLSGVGNAGVVKQVAHQRQLKRLAPVGAGECAQAVTIDHRRDQHHQTKGQITAGRKRQRRVLGQHHRHRENNAPHQPGQHAEADAAQQRGIAQHGCAQAARPRRY